MASARDPGIKRYRPLIVHAEDAGDNGSFARRARWEANVRQGRARRATYTLAQWRANGKLWKPNQLVRVRDAFLGLDETLLVAEVRFKLDDQGGSESELSVVRREAFELIPFPETKGLLNLQ